MRQGAFNVFSKSIENETKEDLGMPRHPVRFELIKFLALESCMDASPGYRWFESVSVSSGGCRSGIIISHGNISSSDSSGGMSKVVSRGTRVWFFQHHL